MPVRAVIIDDERLARKELRRLLEAHPSVDIVGEAANAAEAKKLIAAQEPDLLFLDIEMPEGSGFDLLAALAPVPTVIFTTAFDAHALKAFEVNALDYLLKPIDPKRLAAALERVRTPPRASATKYTDRVFVRDGDRCWFIALSTVPLLESAGNYTLLLLQGQKPLLNRSLSYLEEHLDPEVFFRANRQQLVNLAAIVGIEPGPEGRLVVRLKTGHEVELSRRQSLRFKERMSP